MYIGSISVSVSVSVLLQSYAWLALIAGTINFRLLSSRCFIERPGAVLNCPPSSPISTATWPPTKVALGRAESADVNVGLRTFVGAEVACRV